MAAGGEAEALFSDEALENLRVLGLNGSLNKRADCSYYAIASQEKTQEEAGSGELKAAGTLRRAHLS